MFGSALTNPSQNFVDAFPNVNGYPIDAPGTVYDPAAPYANRDMRLRLWVAYNDSDIILGKPELYLTFAEAANEAWGVTGDPNGYGFTAQSVLDRVLLKHDVLNSDGSRNNNKYLNDVIGEDQAEFRKYVRNCRRLDLSFEGHYYYDLRRWVSDGTTASLNVDVYGMKIIKNANNTYSYERILLEKRDFKSPYQPIPYSELYNAPAIEQNAGW